MGGNRRMHISMSHIRNNIDILHRYMDTLEVMLVPSTEPLTHNINVSANVS